MAQADFNNSTTAPVDPTRRRFLSNTASIAAGGAVLALATIPPVSAGADDGALRLAFENLVATDAAIAGLHKTFGDDADSREDYAELEEKRDECIATLSTFRPLRWQVSKQRQPRSGSS